MGESESKRGFGIRATRIRDTSHADSGYEPRELSVKQAQGVDYRKLFRGTENALILF
jgi:hypothetical protein